jgi:hypothetical protein
MAARKVGCLFYFTGIPQDACCESKKEACRRERAALPTAVGMPICNPTGWVASGLYRNGGLLDGIVMIPAGIERGIAHAL